MEDENLEESKKENVDGTLKDEENETKEDKKSDNDKEKKSESQDENKEDSDSKNQKKLEELKEESLKLKEENNKLNNKLEALKERFERTVAEYENYRKRTAKEKEGIYDDACEDVLKNMFPVLDNLERAISVNGTYEDLKKGIDMTIKQFQKSFEKLGIEEICVEDGFDPNFHNAVMHVEDDNYKEKEIVEVFQKGYKKEDKVLRYSMVKVAN
ncbi:nucleotide exchange factor GrpE [Haloimpatiens sp. FM7315]|uniref:nucleotide exchange factor GrpE n=1 Tax=Haloimpatiens sp. FM7315 TaxID=3298609 RepID=UPI00370C8466